MSSSERSVAYSASTISWASWNRVVRRVTVVERCTLRVRATSPSRMRPARRRSGVGALPLDSRTPAHYAARGYDRADWYERLGEVDLGAGAQWDVAGGPHGGTRPL